MSRTKRAPSALPQRLAELVDGLPTLCTVRQVAEHLHVSTRSVQRWIEDGRLRRLRTSRRGSGRTLIPVRDVAEMLDEMMETRATR